MKKRYSLSLDQEIVEQFKTAAKALNMPSGMMSAICNETIKETTELLRQAKIKGKLTITDMFMMLGKQIENINEEEKKNAEPTPKTKAMAKRATKKTI